MRSKFKSFVRAVWEDVGMSASDILVMIVMAVFIGAMVFSIAFGTSIILCYFASKTWGWDAVQTSISIWILILAVIQVIRYFYMKWREVSDSRE